MIVSCVGLVNVWNRCVYVFVVFVFNLSKLCFIIVI